MSNPETLESVSGVFEAKTEVHDQDVGDELAAELGATAILDGCLGEDNEPMLCLSLGKAREPILDLMCQKVQPGVWFARADILPAAANSAGTAFSFLMKELRTNGFIEATGDGKWRKYKASKEQIDIWEQQLRLYAEKQSVEVNVKESTDTDDGFFTSAALSLDWQALANCLGVEPELFFPERGASTREAKTICGGCEVRFECLEYALEAGMKFGIWGGLSERERRSIRRQRNLARRGTATS